MALLGLDDQLCFALYSASRAMTAAYRPLLTELGLTYPQYLALLVLHEDGCVSVGHLGDRLQLDSGTLSPMLKRMEGIGIVSRRRSADDERQLEVMLTQEGDELARRAECIPEKLFLATGLTEKSIVELRDEIHALTEALLTSRQKEHT